MSATGHFSTDANPVAIPAADSLASVLATDRGRRSLVIFADSASPESLALLRAVLRIARRRDDLSLVAVCDVGRRPPAPYVLAAARALATPLVMRVFDPARRVVFRRAMFTSVRGVARRAGVPLLVPPEHDVNHPGFVDRLRGLRAQIALSLLVAQVFRGPLLAAFDGIVNLHPGRLPGYRGLVPTAWEVYRGEAVAGFSYHLMTRGIDEGPVVAEGTVAVSDGLTVNQLDWAKVERASELGFFRGAPVREGR